MASLVHVEGASVLVHCSDGWDRTSQLCSLAQLLLDPFYRSFQGFQVLIEKEWLSFGHKFSSRCGNGQSNFWDNAETAPIFMQWINCVWQIMQQYPLAFQFNQNFLFFLLEHVYSCDFGTFLCDNEAEVAEKNVVETTRSLWAHVNHPTVFDTFQNPLYQENPLVLFPDCRASNLILWTGYLLRFCRQHVDPSEELEQKCRQIINNCKQLTQEVQSVKSKLAQEQQEKAKLEEKLKRVANRTTIRTHEGSEKPVVVSEMDMNGSFISYSSLKNLKIIDDYDAS